MPPARLEIQSDFLSGNAGAYATQVPDWVNGLLGYLDYLWFAALLGWTLVLMLWWWRCRHTAPAGWRWLPWSAFAGLATTLIVFTNFTAARLGSSARDTYWLGDSLLSAVMALGAAGWWWEASRSWRGLGRWLARSMLLPSLAHTVWVFSFPANAGRIVTTPSSIGLVVLVLLAALPWWWRRPTDLWSRAALALGVVAALVSTVGPLASEVFLMRSRFSSVTPLCAGWAAVHALTAVVVLAGLARLELAKLDRAARRALWHEVQVPGAGALAAILLGLIAAGAVGSRQRREASERAMDQARLAAAPLDPDAFARLTGPEFRIDPHTAVARPAFPPTRLAPSQFLAQGGGESATRALRPVARAARTMLHLRFLTLRDGWLVGAINYNAPIMDSLAPAFASTPLDANASRPRPASGQVLLARKPTALDLARWSEKAEWIEGPLYTPVFASPVVFARAPVVARDGRMLGWIEFTYMADAFLAETMQARIAPFVGATLGVVLMGLFFMHRRNARDREAAQRAVAVAAESARLKSDFIAQVSHELRTPLQNILGYAELLHAEAKHDPTRARIAAVQQDSTSMLRLVNDLLDLGAMEAGAFRFVEEPVSLPPLVTHAVDSLRPRAAAKKLELGCTIAPDFPPWVVTDGERVRQILLNLAGNAVKFTDQGRIDVELRALGGDVDGRQTVELTVRDTGPGIAPAHHAHLFQPFSRLDLTTRKEGSGLGLALAAALCRSAGGALTLESDGRTGACFRARLVVRLSAPPANRTPPVRLFPSLRGRRVLLADDNALVRDLFAAWLAELGATCEHAADGGRALELATERVFDVVILDIAMPRLDGLTVARRLRSVSHHPRIVGVSAHAAISQRSQAFAAGMDAFLSKPVDLATLAATLTAEAIPPLANQHAHLRAGLIVRFRAGAPEEAAGLATAVQRRAWAEIKRRAHHLKSGAGVVQDDALYEACIALEDAADLHDANAADEAWRHCAACLQATWVGPTVPPS